MGAFFTRLLQSQSTPLQRFTRYFFSLRVVQAVRKLNIPWPPQPSTVVKFAPILFCAVYLPKLAWDVRLIFQTSPVDEELQRESDEELHFALFKAKELLNAFKKANIAVPPNTVESRVKGLIFECIDAVLSRPEYPASAGNISSEPGSGADADSDPDCSDESADECEESAAEQTPSTSSLFDLEERLAHELSHGNWADPEDELDERLKSIESNVGVVAERLRRQRSSHPLFLCCEETIFVVGMLQHWAAHLCSRLACYKTQNSSLPKWNDGKLLSEMEEQYPYEMDWYARVPPRKYAARTGRKPTTDHWSTANESAMELRSFAKLSPVVQEASCVTLEMLEIDVDERSAIISSLQKSKMKKILNAVRLVVGDWRNWAMVATGWVGELLEGLIDGALVFYRSALLISAQKVSAAALTTSTSSSSQSSRHKDLWRVITAIIVSEIAKIIVVDIKSKVDDLGESAIRMRLQYMLGERILAQDLETHDEKKKAQDRSYRWGLTPGHLLRSFPLSKFFQLPSTSLRVLSTTVTTAFLLFSKNSFLALVVLCTLVAQRVVFDRIRDLKALLWYGYLWGGESISGQRNSTVNIFQAINHFYDVRVNGNELHHLRQLHRKDEAVLVEKDRRSAFDSIYSSITAIISELPTITTYAVGSTLIAKGTLEPSDLVMFPKSIQDLLDEWEDLWEEYTSLYDFDDHEIQQLDAIVELLNEKPRIGIRGGYIPESGHLEDTTIEFRDVAFRRSSWPIRQTKLSFRAPRGSFVAVCGKNGVGKSTLFKLLLRLYDVDEGQILLGGRNITEYNPVWLRSRAIAMAPQKPGMYRGKLRENFVYGSEERIMENKMTTDEIDAQLENVLERAGSLNIFKNARSFPQGFDSYKDASELSGGQQRAIGLARALFRNTDILLLDEPTNDLDPDRQQAVKTSLIEKRPKGQTIICITHELSTIRDADMIVFFSKDESTGETTISGTGTYSQLLKSCDTFRRWHEFKWPSHDDHEPGHDNHDTNPHTANDYDQHHNKVLTPPALARSKTWSRARTHDLDPDSNPVSPGSRRKQREREKLKFQKMKTEVQQLSTLSGTPVGSRAPQFCGNETDFVGIQQRIDELSDKTVMRLLPQYEKLVDAMKIRVKEFQRERDNGPRSFRRLVRSSGLKSTPALHRDDDNEKLRPSFRGPMRAFSLK